MTTLIMTADTIGQRLIDLYKKINAYFAAKSMQKRTQRELTRLTDRELQDIGLHRGMVGYAAHEAYKIEMEKQLGRNV